MSHDDASNDERPVRVKLSPLAAFVLALIVYPFSFGPVIWFADRVLQIRPSDSFGRILTVTYHPIFWLCENYSTVKVAIRWYLSLFGVH